MYPQVLLPTAWAVAVKPLQRSVSLRPTGFQQREKMASPFANASPPHLPLAAQRQLELELAALRRAVARAFTSLDVGRRKWAAQSESGKRSLSACLNGMTQLAYAEGAHWGALAGCTEMHRLVAVRALHKLRAGQAEVDGTLEVCAHPDRDPVSLRLTRTLTRTRTHNPSPGAYRDTARFGGREHDAARQGGGDTL